MQFNSGFAATRGSWSPLLTYGDTISWNKGKHAFKGGVEFRRDRSDGWNDNNITPFATIGAGNFTAPIDNTVTGLSALTSNNGTTARNILYNLSGSIDNIKEGFDLRSSQKPVFLGYADGVKLKERDWHANEVTAFFKDAWKVTSNLTLNLGVKWEWYGVPYEARGLAGRVVNGIQGLCGIACGALTTVELVGKNSPQPDKKLYNDDWNNFGPSIGFSYALHGLGRSTILRAGYGVNFAGRQLDGVQQGGGLDAGGGTLPGLSGISGGNGLTYTQTSYWNLANDHVTYGPAVCAAQCCSVDRYTAASNEHVRSESQHAVYTEFHLVDSAGTGERACHGRVVHRKQRQRAVRFARAEQRKDDRQWIPERL